MYNSIISQAIRKNAALDKKGLAPLSAAGNNAEAGSSYMGGPAKRGGTSSSKYNDGGRVTVGLSTSSSMRSQDQGAMPHLIPQKTNVLTGAATKYFADQANSWKQDYTDLVQFQKARAHRLGELESAVA